MDYVYDFILLVFCTLLEYDVKKCFCRSLIFEFDFDFALNIIETNLVILNQQLQATMMINFALIQFKKKMFWNFCHFKDLALRT